MHATDSIIFISSESPNIGVHIIINGRDLVEIIRDIELPFATHEGSPGIAGKYSGLPADIVLLPSRHLLGGQTHFTPTTMGEFTFWVASVASQAVGHCRRVSS